MIGELFINNKDAYSTWHVYMDSTSLSQLMTPPPAKEYITEDNLLGNGEIVYDDRVESKILFDARDFMLTVCISAHDEATFFSRYNAFVSELQKGFITIRTKYQPTTEYKCIYRSCQQFTQFRRGFARIALRLREPNPTNRTYEAGNN